MMLRTSILIITFLVQFSCSGKLNNDNKDELAVCMLGYPSTGLPEIIICNRSNCDTINLRSSLGTGYHSFRWSNKDSLIICTEYANGVRNLVYLNQAGKVVDRVFQFDKVHPIYDIFPSPKESLVLLQYRYSETPLSMEQDANYPSNLGVVDINNDSIACTIEGIVPIQMVYINDSPWSPDESKFLFTVSTGPKFIFYGVDSVPEYNYKIFEPGVYEYDLRTKHYSLVIKNASCATWSPDGKYIVYVLDNCLYRSSSDFSTKELLYDARTFERISRGLFWVNNGKCLLFRSFIRPFGIPELSNQKVKIIWMDDKRCELTNLNLLNGLYDIKDEK
jgi:hypothetical protein